MKLKTKNIEEIINIKLPKPGGVKKEECFGNMMGFLYLI